MSKLILPILILAITAIAAEKTPVDLIREGRVVEARRIIEQSQAPERYTLLLDAISEPNAIEACFLYREISSRFPGTDCDVFAQERLLQAAELGIDISALVLEKPDITHSDLESPEHQYEVERPLAVSTTVPEELRSPYPTPSEAALVTAAEPTPEKSADRTPIASTAMPSVVSVSVPLEEKKPEAPALAESAKPTETSSGVTLDYDVVAKSDTVVKQAGMTPDQSFVRSDDKVIEKNPAISAAPVQGVKPVPEIEKPHDVEPDGGEWYIQVGAFGNLANADKIAARLRSAGYKVVLVPFDEGDRHLMQVRVGGYADKTESRRIGDEIHAKFNVPAVLVTQ